MGWQEPIHDSRRVAVTSALQKLNDDENGKRRFLELYSKGRQCTLSKLLELCEVRQDQYLAWLDDPEFMQDMEAAQTKIFFLAKDEIVRNVGLICHKLVISATSGETTTSNSLKAAELILKITGLISQAGGGKTNVTINNTAVEHQTNLKGMSIEELNDKRDELSKILKAFKVEPAEFEETTS